MNIKIPTTKRTFFRQSLEILRALPPLDKLRNKELDVLGELLYYDYIYKNIDKELRGKVVFDYDTKLQMREHIGIDEQQFFNILTSLRKKGILKGKNVFMDFGLNPDNPEMLFKFIIKDEK